jgi:hypothetical protein
MPRLDGAETAKQTFAVFHAVTIARQGDQR